MIAGAVLLADLWAALSPAVLAGAGLAALLCVAALFGRALRNARERDRGLRSALTAERAYAEEATALVRSLVPALSVLALEGVLRWTAETARELLKAPYAHVAVVTVGEGSHHWTAVGGERDAYPSWWHPTVQRLVQGLVLRGRLEAGEVARSDEVVHGIEGFVAVPVLRGDGERLGAIIVGGTGVGPAEERLLRVLAGQAGHALHSALDAPGGRDPASDLPNRASLRRFLRGELSRGRALTVLMIGLHGLPRQGRTHVGSAEADLLRRLGRGLGGNGRRAFRFGDDALVVTLGGADAPSALGAALHVRRTVAELSAGTPVTASVGFAAARPAPPGPSGDPDEVLGAAAEALRRAEGRPEGVAGPPADAAASRDSRDAPPRESRGAGEPVLVLVAAVAARDPGLAEHSRSVAYTARRLGARMGLAPGEQDGLVAGALLHDVGKIGLPDAVLLKPGPLSGEEHEAMKRHPELGADILGSVGGLAPALGAVRHHHERWDGGGYPDGLRGEEIPLLARVVFVADALDALTRDRPYRRGVPEREALEEIARNSGTQFDPRVVGALMEVAGEQGRRVNGSAG